MLTCVPFATQVTRPAEEVADVRSFAHEAPLHDASTTPTKYDGGGGDNVVPVTGADHAELPLAL